MAECETMYKDIRNVCDNQEEFLSKTTQERDALRVRLADAENEKALALAAQAEELEQRFSKTLDAQRTALLQQVALVEDKLHHTESVVEHLRHMNRMVRRLDSHDIEDHPGLQLELAQPSTVASPVLVTSFSRGQTLCLVSVVKSSFSTATFSETTALHCDQRSN